MAVAQEARCPGTGLRMVYERYVIRTSDPRDREEYAWRAERARSRGEEEDAAGWENALREWEREQGQTRERLVCVVCRSPWLKPTSKGTARPHRRETDAGQPSWDRVRQIRAEIKALQAELDRALDILEPNGT